MNVKTYPRVLRNPQTFPSANSETISPKCKKLAISPILTGYYCYSEKKH